MNGHCAQQEYLLLTPWQVLAEAHRFYCSLFTISQAHDPANITKRIEYTGTYFTRLLCPIYHWHRVCRQRQMSRVLTLNGTAAPQTRLLPFKPRSEICMDPSRSTVEMGDCSETRRSVESDWTASTLCPRGRECEDAPRQKWMFRHDVAALDVECFRRSANKQ